jgi:penicillin amidase
VLTSHVF